MQGVEYDPSEDGLVDRLRQMYKQDKQSQSECLDELHRQVQKVESPYAYLLISGLLLSHGRHNEGLESLTAALHTSKNAAEFVFGARKLSHLSEKLTGYGCAPVISCRNKQVDIAKLALTYYQKALELAPWDKRMKIEYTQFQANLPYLYTLKDIVNSFVHRVGLRRILRNLDDGDERCFVMLIQACRKKGMPEEAEVQKIWEGHDPTGYPAMARAHIIGEDNPELAAELYRKAIEIDPDNHAARIGFERMYELIYDGDPKFAEEYRNVRKEFLERQPSIS